MCRYIVTGATGQVGTALLANSPGGVIGLSRDDMDITNLPQVKQRMADLRPQAVIHAGAWTDVDACENDRAKAWRVNLVGTANVAQACACSGARLVYVSTDYVFDGSAVAPYVPSDPVAPLSVYGMTKLAGELAVRTWLPEAHVILRTSWVFSAHGHNFLRTILRLAEQQSVLRVVNDQHGCPTHAGDLSRWLWAVAEGKCMGTLHACNADACTWFEFARTIVLLGGLSAQVVPVATSAFPRPARRPRYSVLSTTRLTECTGIVPRPWREAAAEVLGGLLPAGGTSLCGS